MPCSHLTRCRRSVEVNLLAVLPEPRLVAAPHPEDVHAVHLQPLDHRTGPLHLVQTLPRRGGAGGAGAAPRRSGSSGSPLVLHGKVPGRSRVLREAPAQEQLVVSEGFLSVDDRSQRSCREGGEQIRVTVISSRSVFVMSDQRGQAPPWMNCRPLMSLISLDASR